MKPENIRPSFFRDGSFQPFSVLARGLLLVINGNVGILFLVIINNRLYNICSFPKTPIGQGNLFLRKNVVLMTTGRKEKRENQY